MSSTTRQVRLINISEHYYQNTVLVSPEPHLLQFWAPWCVPCMLMKKTVTKASELLDGEVQIGLVNVDEQPELVNQFAVSGTPTFVLVHGGSVIGAFTGITTASGIVAKVNEMRASARI